MSTSTKLGDYVDGLPGLGQDTQIGTMENHTFVNIGDIGSSSSDDGSTFSHSPSSTSLCSSSDFNSLRCSPRTSSPSSILAGDAPPHVERSLDILATDQENAHFGDRQDAFFLAALEGSYSLIEQYIESDPTLVYRADKDGQTALLIAAGAERFDVVRFLCISGANVNHRDKTGATPIYRATAKNDIQTVSFLVDRGADLDISCNNGFTPLIIASLAGHLDAITYLHNAGANMELAECNGLTPFLVACAGSGDVDVVRYLLETACCDMHKAEKNGCSSFILAAGAGHLDVCKYLLENGAMIDAQSSSGFTATFSACSSGNVEVVRFLAEAGADIEIRSNKGSTPLYIAAVHGHLDIVTYLYSIGGNIEAADNNGLTALHASVGAGGSSIKVFAFLINCGSDITKRDINDRKPLDYARRDPLHMLISIIASIWHESPFHKACYEDDVDSLRVLLEEQGRAGTSYFSLNCVGRDAWTPLHVAAYFNRVECAQLLLEAGADTNAVTFNRLQTPLMMCAAKNYTELVQLIVSYQNNTKRRSCSHR